MNVYQANYEDFVSNFKRFLGSIDIMSPNVVFLTTLNGLSGAPQSH